MPSPTRSSRTSCGGAAASTSGSTSCPARCRSTGRLAGRRPGVAAAIVWLDGLVTNPTGRRSNPNLLVWHGNVWLIDHGAALYVHHTWRDPDEHARRPFERCATTSAAVRELDRRVGCGLAALVTDELLERLVADLPTPGCRTTRWSAIPRPSAARIVGTCGCGWTPRVRSSRRPSVPDARVAHYQYAIVRVVPRVERGER
jgi:hypothetical protein